MHNLKHQYSLNSFKKTNNSHHERETGYSEQNCLYKSANMFLCALKLEILTWESKGFEIGPQLDLMKLVQTFK